MQNVEDLSFITIQDLTSESRWLFISDSITDILGWEPRELVGRSPFSIIHPEELDVSKDVHYEAIEQDKAAAVSYIRLRHKAGHYVLCMTAATVVHCAVIVAVSVATNHPGTVMKAATAQEVIVISKSPEARRFQFQKWSNSAGDGNTPHAHPYTPLSFNLLPTPSPRTGLILNRFSLNAQILFCTPSRSRSHGSSPSTSTPASPSSPSASSPGAAMRSPIETVLDPAIVTGRSLYDFVSPADEEDVRGWIESVKSWGRGGNTNPHGGEQGGFGNGGGFGYGSFKILRRGRWREPLYPPSQAKGKSKATKRGSGSSSRGHGRGSSQSSPVTAHAGNTSPSSPTDSLQGEANDEIEVQAIFSAHSDGLIVILRRS